MLPTSCAPSPQREERHLLSYQEGDHGNCTQVEHYQFMYGFMYSQYLCPQRGKRLRRHEQAGKVKRGGEHSRERDHCRQTMTAQTERGGPEQAVSRILFPSRFAAAASSNHLSRTAITRRLQRPTRRGNGRATRRRHQHTDGAIPPVWPCSRWGLPQPIGHPIAGELLPRHFNLTCCQAVCFCGTFPGVTPAGRYPASRSVEFGLSSGSPQAARDCFAYSDPSSTISSLRSPRQSNSSIQSSQGIQTGRQRTRQKCSPGS
jgi:hypothetical protein